MQPTTLSSAEAQHVGSADPTDGFLSSIMVRHIAGIAEIVEDIEAAVRFYRDVLGLEVRREADAPYATVEVPGVLHFGIWARAAAAQSAFGDAKHARRIPLGFTVGFEVDDVNVACQALHERNREVLQWPRAEPWGQVTARFLSANGSLLEVSKTPWARRLAHNVAADSPETPASRKA